MRYFENFPVIEYDDVKVKNILTRVKLVESSKTSKTVYHPFTIIDGETPQKIAYDYYGSTDYTALIFLTNNIIDPYYDWPLSTVEFENHIKKKYGSLAVAQSTILWYQKHPTQYYVSISDPNDFRNVTGFTGDASKYKLITQDNEIKISVDTYERSPDLSFYPVDAYAYESEQNEAKRNIRLLDRSYVRMFDRELKALLSA
jgi:hypothetical protein